MHMLIADVTLSLSPVSMVTMQKCKMLLHLTHALETYGAGTLVPFSNPEPTFHRASSDMRRREELWGRECSSFKERAWVLGPQRS